MKIAYIYTALTTIGGVDRILSVKANYLADKLGYDVHIITDSQAGKPLSFPLSTNIKHIDLETDFDEQYHCPNIISRFFCYRRLMKQYRQRLSTLLIELHCDVVCTTCGRDLDFLHTIQDGSRKIGEIHCVRRSFRNFHLMEAKGFPYNLVVKYWRYKNEQVIKKLDAFVVLTQHDAKTWNEVRPCTIIPNPNTITVSTSLNSNSKRIISVGRLSEEKGFERLIEAWSLIAKDCPYWHIDIYGEGLLYNQLNQQIKKLNLQSSVHILPPTKNIANEYCNSAFYVMSSRYEGFGLVLTEAMSCGIPCVAFNCPSGPTEIIRDNEDGILVKDGDINALSEKMKLLINDTELRKRLGSQAKINVERFAIDHIMNSWHKLFTSVSIKE